MTSLQRIIVAALFAAMSLPAAAQQMPMNSQDPSMPSHQADSVGTAMMMEGHKMGMMHCPMMQQHEAGMHSMSEGRKEMMNMMHRKMMERSMDHPMSNAAMMVEMLPTMKDALDLTDEQASEIDKLARESESRQSELTSQATQAEGKAADLLRTENPDPTEVKSLFREAATRRADAKAAKVETFIRMKDQLDAGQRERLANMTPESMHEHAMLHMSMMQLMDMMHGDSMSGCMMMGTQ